MPIHMGNEGHDLRAQVVESEQAYAKQGEGNLAANVGPRMKIYNIIRTLLRWYSCLVSICCVIIGVVGFILKQSDPLYNIVCFWLCFFGPLMLLAEFGQRHVRIYFKFLAHRTGRGMMFVFLGSLGFGLQGSIGYFLGIIVTFSGVALLIFAYYSSYTHRSRHDNSREEEEEHAPNFEVTMSKSKTQPRHDHEEDHDHEAEPEETIHEEDRNEHVVEVQEDFIEPEEMPEPTQEEEYVEEERDRKHRKKHKKHKSRDRERRRRRDEDEEEETADD